MRTISVLIALLLTTSAQAAGFRENQSWQFEDVFKKAIKLQAANMVLLKRGGFYEGSHAAKYTTIEAVNYNIDTASFDDFQSVTNIGNATTIQVDGEDNTLNVEQSQDGDQDGLNVSAGGDTDAIN